MNDIVKAISHSQVYLFADEKLIAEVHNIKYLGVYIDNKLAFKEHLRRREHGMNLKETATLELLHFNYVHGYN
jgi:hypothetical protein